MQLSLCSLNSVTLNHMKQSGKVEEGEGRMLDGMLVEATLICSLNIKFKLYPMRKVLLLLKTFKPKKEKKTCSGCSVRKGRWRQTWWWGQ